MSIDTWWNDIILRAYDHQTSEAYEAYQDLYDLVTVIKACIIWIDGTPHYRTANGIPQEMPRKLHSTLNHVLPIVQATEGK